MPQAELHHCEIFADDAPSIAHYFVTAYGFTVAGVSGPETGNCDAFSILLISGNIRLVVTSALTPSHPARSFVDKHGYGVRTIAQSVPDAALAHDTAVSRGARSVAAATSYVDQDDARTVIAEVGGAGDLVHRFVEQSSSAWRLPGFRLREPVGAGNDLLSIDHFALCVPAGELAATAAFYQEVLGYQKVFEERVVLGDQAMDSQVVRDATGSPTLVIAESDPERPAAQVETFVRLHGGAGVQHVAFSVDDLAKSARALRASGVEFLQAPAQYYETLETRIGQIEDDIEDLRALNILVDRDHDGQLLQIFSTSPHVRRTLFFEVIERRAATTFGSGNIRALYEAVRHEQERLGMSAVPGQEC
ncbi:4-hydroxyphenylpyruvate dioxygenase [Micromonospora parva]|uniref:4-hydroxyphenylpyruvate dioxygenase n=1 Tax=Micromonospora parva TaxID=1464048 RepID=UPI0033CD7AD8